MTSSSPLALERLNLSFELDPGDAAGLRGLPLLRRLTQGRAQTRLAASGAGFRSHRRLKLEGDVVIDFLLSLDPSGIGAGEAAAESGGLRARLQLAPVAAASDSFLPFVQALHARVPLRLSPSQDHASVSVVELSALDPDQSADIALAAILRRCQHDMLRWIDLAWRELKPEAVHQSRVSLRRLRAALALFKPLLPPSLADDLNAEARWLGTILAPTRDLDVFIAETLAPFHDHLPDDPGLQTLTSRAAADRDAAARQLAEDLRSPRCLAFFVGLEMAIEGRIWRARPAPKARSALFAPLRDVAPGLLDRLWRAARRDAKRLGDGGPEAAHDLRKKIKKLRYSIEFVQCIGGKKDVKLFLAEVSQLQQRLGVANDMTVAEALVARLCDPQPSLELSRIWGYIAGWSARGSGGAQPDAAEGWRRLCLAPKFWRDGDDPP